MQTLLSQICRLGGLLALGALGLRANLAESDLAAWWVWALRLTAQGQTLPSRICRLGGFALALKV